MLAAAILRDDLNKLTTHEKWEEVVEKYKIKPMGSHSYSHQIHGHTFPCSHLQLQSKQPQPHPSKIHHGNALLHEGMRISIRAAEDA